MIVCLEVSQAVVRGIYKDEFFQILIK